MTFVERLAHAAESRRQYPTYGSCFRCGMSWGVVKSHSTTYAFGDGGTAMRGCFPLCADCWTELGTPEARRPFYEALLLEWKLLDCPIAVDEGKAILWAVEAGR